jgi:hypothetical protein
MPSLPTQHLITGSNGGYFLKLFLFLHSVKSPCNLKPANGGMLMNRKHNNDTDLMGGQVQRWLSLDSSYSISQFENFTRPGLICQLGVT